MSTGFWMAFGLGSGAGFVAGIAVANFVFRFNRAVRSWNRKL